MSSQCSYKEGGIHPRPGARFHSLSIAPTTVTASSGVSPP
jgi:hypothetical protein